MHRSEDTRPGEIVGRAARRRCPAGWIAPGPAPAAPLDRPELWPGAGEELCCLTGDWRILQRVGGHRWSLDDLVTAWFAAESRAAPPPAVVADLGCGIGAVLLMLAWRFPAARCIGIEAQAESVALARRSIAWNGAAARCTVVGGDLRERAGLPPAGFDLVSGTPPYLPRGTGREPTRALQAACHLEHRGGIEAYCTAAAALLAPGGRFVVCHSNVRRTEAAARAADLTIESRLDVIPRDGKPVLFSVFAMAREPMALVAVNELVVRDRDGQWTEPFRAVRRAMGMPV